MENITLKLPIYNRWHVVVEGEVLQIPSLDDIIKSKREANRPKDKAVLEILELTRDERGKLK